MNKKKNPLRKRGFLVISALAVSFIILSVLVSCQKKRDDTVTLSEESNSVSEVVKAGSENSSDTVDYRYLYIPLDGE
jgi:mannitol-specific phosphotransferase system IIBC component